MTYLHGGSVTTRKPQILAELKVKSSSQGDVLDEGQLLIPDSSFLSLGRRRLGRIIIKLVLVNHLYVVKNKRVRIFMGFGSDGMMPLLESKKE